MHKERNCLLLRCSEVFEPEHGNQWYCCIEHQAEARKERQKERRDPIALFILILMRNHEVIDKLYNEGEIEPSRKLIEAYGFDISLCRYMQPPPEHHGKLMLDVGDYFLITDTQFLTFKIFKHGYTSECE